MKTKEWQLVEVLHNGVWHEACKTRFPMAALASAEARWPTIDAVRITPLAKTEHATDSIGYKR